jgi:hypothetical protein
VSTIGNVINKTENTYVIILQDCGYGNMGKRYFVPGYKISTYYGTAMYTAQKPDLKIITELPNDHQYNLRLITRSNEISESGADVWIAGDFKK